MKTIVTKTEIIEDRKLAVVKAFRIANKRAGEFKRAAMESQDAIVQQSNIDQFNAKCQELHALAAEAERLGFKIWVNPNGRTGHTYEKDYKVTPNADNDITLFEAYLARENTTMSALLGQLMADRQSRN